ncbi:MAG: CpsB/CapC family capsule biosynthesis tyrosine phosphatase [Rikenellaceae bacterium]
MFFSRKISIVELLKNFADYHTHILPGVDDGVQTTEEALQILSFYEEQGVKKVIFTPHIMEELPKNSTEFLRAEFAKFQQLYNGKLELSLAAEYMLDSGFNKHLKSGELLCLFDNYVLVEMSYAVATVDYKSIISEIMSRGYFVVLAHPERYLYLRKEEYRELKGMGVMFQLNFPSLLGVYGKGVQERAKWLLEASYYDLVGSDVHNFRYYSDILNRGKLSKSHIGIINTIRNRLPQNAL